jgi:hypothetical protein
LNDSWLYLRYGLEGPVFAVEKDSVVHYQFDQNKQTILRASDETVQLELFQPCKVQIKIEGGAIKQAGEMTDDPACRSRLVISLLEPALPGISCTPEQSTELKVGEKRKREDV